MIPPWSALPWGPPAAPVRRGQRGVALTLAVFALAVLGALAGASLLLAGHERLLGRNVLRQAQAFSVAEAAAQGVVLDPASQYLEMALGGQAATSGLGPGGRFEQTVTRVGPEIFLATAHGFSPDGAARQRIGFLFALQRLPVAFRAALTIQGNLRVGGESAVHGSDQLPPDSAGCGPLQDVPGVYGPDPDSIDVSACSGAPCVSGSPPFMTDSTRAGPDISGEAGPLDSLRSWVTKTVLGGDLRIEPSVVALSCNAADPANWGDPLPGAGPCGRYFPVVWIEGDATLHGLRGQGVLLVNGNLGLRGAFLFHGAVLVAGALTSDGTGGQVVGAVTVLGQDSSWSALLGAGGIAYSSCAVSRSLSSSARLRPLTSRGWLDLY
ncbi:MAG TPA: hypothetical protein VD793_00510 [Gemmatimonadales bacterium]|nr:hypothetical protein [Gemmatimonadales bacterium]